LFIFIYVGALKGKINEPATRFKIYILMSSSLIAFVAMSYFYITHDNMKGQDKFHLLWCQTIIIMKFAGIFFTASKVYFSAKKRNELEIEIAKLKQPDADELVQNTAINHGHDEGSDQDKQEHEGGE